MIYFIGKIDKNLFQGIVEINIKKLLGVMEVNIPLSAKEIMEKLKY